jgi:hypothetical protein
MLSEFRNDIIFPCHTHNFLSLASLFVETTLYCTCFSNYSMTMLVACVQIELQVHAHILAPTIAAMLPTKDLFNRPAGTFPCHLGCFTITKKSNHDSTRMCAHNHTHCLTTIRPQPKCPILQLLSCSSCRLNE